MRSVRMTSVTVLLVSLFTSASLADLRVPVEGTNGAIFVKAIIRSTDASISEEPGGKGKKTPAAPFKIFYYLQTDDGAKEVAVDGKPWIRLGTGSTKPVGWIAKEDVVLWNTRALLYPRANAISKATPFVLYRSVNLKRRVGAIEQLTGSQISVCPIFSPPEDFDDPVYNVSFFAAKATSPTGVKATTPSDQDVELKRLGQDVVFVIDTTVSMTALLDGLRRIAKLSARHVAPDGPFSDLNGRIRFGLVEYQDSTPGLFPSRVTIPLTSDLEEFASELAEVRVTNRGSEETKEDVLAGLKTAITDNKVGWANHSLKHIILLGDASAHLQGRKNTTGLTIKEVIDLARPQSGSESARLLTTITLHAIRAINPVDESDHAACKRQFTTIARNNDQEQGFYADVDPTDEKDVQDTVDNVVALMGKTYATMLDIVNANKHQSPPAGAIARKVWTLYGLSQLEEHEEVFTGFATEVNENGRRVADLRLLVTFTELKRLESNLKFIHNRLSTFRDDPDERKDLGNLLASIQVLAASTAVGDFVSASKLKDVIPQIPFRSSLLETTAADIATMTNEDYDQWLSSINSTRTRATALLDKADNWNQLIGDDTNDASRFTFLRPSELLFDFGLSGKSTKKSANQARVNEQQIAWARSSGRSVTMTNSIGMTLKLIPPGEFLMGSPDTETGHAANESPQTRVRIRRPFYMSAFEVTQAEYERVMRENPSWFNSKRTREDRSRYPVESVSFVDAVKFCKQLSSLPEEIRSGRAYRLPSEAEWEYSCRAGTTSPYYFGDKITSELANVRATNAKGRGRISTVGAYEPNGFGLHDMHGNMAEWVLDRGDSEYSGKLEVNPMGADAGFRRRVRGGNHYLPVQMCRSAYRGNTEEPWLIDEEIGFRVICVDRRQLPDNWEAMPRLTESPQQVSIGVWSATDLFADVDGKRVCHVDRETGFDYDFGDANVTIDSIITFKIRGLSIDRRLNDIGVLIEPVPGKLELKIRVGPEGHYASTLPGKVTISDQQYRVSMGSKSDIPSLAKRLRESPESKVRAWIVQRLGHIAHKDTVPILIGALKDKDDYVKARAAGALGDIGDKSALPALRKAYSTYQRKSSYGYFFDSAIKALDESR